MTHLLDTSVFCQPIKDHPVDSVLERWSDVGDIVVCTSAICLAEVLQGLEQRQSKKYWRRYRELLEGRHPVLPVDEAVAVQFAKLASVMHGLGRPRPTVDLLIAATARHHGLRVATLNQKHFEDVPGLTVENWGSA